MSQHVPSSLVSPLLSTSTSEVNRPRNHLIRDATTAYEFTYMHYGQIQRVVVDQTPEEETYPGGALWDIAVLLAILLVHLHPTAKYHNNDHHNKNNQHQNYLKLNHHHNNQKYKQNDNHINQNSKLIKNANRPNSYNNSDDPLQSFLYNVSKLITKKWKDCTVLELGCGVGLTGLVAASLGAKTTILTDLEIVIEKVTRHNLQINQFSNGKVQWNGNNNNNIQNNNNKNASISQPHKMKCIAMPLCWGNKNDEQECAQFLSHLHKHNNNNNNYSKKRLKKKQDNSDIDDTDASKPDIILIGDVAYQHKPGAPSHFDDLLSTLLQFVGEHTVVLFGTRMRMPASHDLLQMFREHMEERVVPPLGADSIDKAFDETNLGALYHAKKRKHNIT
eukprot:CAMPEP_0184866564 /NCGR_PEP_ID=MMETSP0580-20130426/22793_1 /TAXON_ID=1118495 /ORGANISM="Dactyliosolen fragilissimus" /LENGTH=389 /DNA_ID=CAMNT_0027366303 /DNA_START=908 /DNA_END=2074 /DNA_ORIENTATION=+